MSKFSLEHLIRNLMSEEHKSVDQLDERAGILLKVAPKPFAPAIPKPQNLPVPKPPSSPPVTVPKPKSDVTVPATPSTSPATSPSTTAAPKTDTKPGASPAVPNPTATDTKTKEKKDEEPELAVNGGNTTDKIHKGARVPVKTGISLAQKRRKLHFEELETKNRKLVSVVKKAVDDKKKPSKKSNNVVDLHPTLNEPDERDQEVR